jgi:hypothetical protein
MVRCAGGANEPGHSYGIAEGSLSVLGLPIVMGGLRGWGTVQLKANLEFE